MQRLANRAAAASTALMALWLAGCAFQPLPAQAPDRPAAAVRPALVMILDADATDISKTAFGRSVGARYPAPLAKDVIEADLTAAGFSCATGVGGPDGTYTDCVRPVASGEACFDVFALSLVKAGDGVVVPSDVRMARRCLGALE